MSPRRNRSSRSDRTGGRQRGGQGWDPERARWGAEAVETWGAESYRVRHVPGSGAAKTYRCPGCAQEISAGVPHVVAWPESGLAGFGGESDRRHWHTGCWRARDRRRPTS